MPCSQPSQLGNLVKRIVYSRPLLKNMQKVRLVNRRSKVERYKNLVPIMIKTFISKFRIKAIWLSTRNIKRITCHVAKRRTVNCQVVTLIISEPDTKIGCKYMSNIELAKTYHSIKVLINFRSKIVISHNHSTWQLVQSG